MISHGTLEANICRHCVKRCASCSHASPFAAPYNMPVDVLRDDLAALSRFMHVKQMYLLGGEPLLHPQLMDLIAVVNESPIGDETCILTNGMLLSRQPEEFWRNIDVLRVSVYPDLDREEIRLAERKSKEHGFYLGLDFISVFWRQFRANPGGESFKGCPWRGACWTVHAHHFYLCPQAVFWTDQFMDLPQNIDGLPLDDTLTEEKLLAYVNREKPFHACLLCSSYTRQEPWKESATKEEWFRDSTV